MITRVSLLLLLALGAAMALVVGCGSATSEQEADSSSAAPSAPQAAAAVESQPATETVEVGYQVGLRAPEFGMSLFDGSRVTSTGLAEEGTPVFLYFHATY